MFSMSVVVVRRRRLRHVKWRPRVRIRFFNRNHPSITSYSHAIEPIVTSPRTPTDKYAEGRSSTLRVLEYDELPCQELLGMWYKRPDTPRPVTSCVIDTASVSTDDSLCTRDENNAPGAMSAPQAPHVELQHQPVVTVRRRYRRRDG